MNETVIGIGSNINPEKHIKLAGEILAKQFEVIATSSFVTTKPIGGPKQPDFINGAILLKTRLDKEVLNRELKVIEKQLGRPENSDKFGPRTIDLDIVVWNNEIIDKDFYDRDFLRNSVYEVLPSVERECL